MAMLVNRRETPPKVSIVRCKKRGINPTFYGRYIKEWQSKCCSSYEECHERQLGDSPTMPLNCYTYHTRDLHLKGFYRCDSSNFVLEMKYELSVIDSELIL